MLTVIIVNWNTREMLRVCLSSVFNNLLGLSTEVIVVDNASEDHSVAMIRSDFPSVKLIANSKNLGFAAANNQAMQIAKGTYVLLLNSDTIVHGNVLRASYDYMETHHNVAVLGCRVLNTDGSLQYTCSQYPSLVNKILQTTALEKLRWPRILDKYRMTYWKRDTERDVDVISGCYMFVRSRAIDAVGLFDEDFFFFGEEVDWCRRFSEKGFALRFAPIGVITHHGGGSAKRLNDRRDVLLGESHVRLQRKYGGAFSAAAMWIVLLIFNASRACFWFLKSTVTRSSAARQRASHFKKVTRGFLGALHNTRNST